MINSLIFLVICLFCIITFVVRKIIEQTKRTARALRYALSDKDVTYTLTLLREQVFNKEFEGIARIRTLAFRGKSLVITIVLNGLESRPVAVLCRDVHIAEDGSSITLACFRSTIRCIENILNDFAARTYAVHGDDLRDHLGRLSFLCGLR